MWRVQTRQDQTPFQDLNTSNIRSKSELEKLKHAFHHSIKTYTLK